MPQCKQIIGVGRNAEEALLFARVNQCCHDKCIKTNTISRKTDFIEIPYDIEVEGTARTSKIIMALHFAAAYYTFQQNSIANNIAEMERGFTDSEYKYYSIIVKQFGSKKFNEIMKCYFGNTPDTCLAIRNSKNNYIFIY